MALESSCDGWHGMMRTWEDQLSRLHFRLLLLALLTMVVSRADAGRALKMNLEELCRRADKILRGTVIGMEFGSIQLGGAELGTVTYRLRVEEALKGSYDDSGIVEVTMLSGDDSQASSGPYQRFGLDLGLPRLQKGRDYVLFLSRPSAIGLSSTIGLGQGCFLLEQVDKALMVRNELGNVGLFDGMSASGAQALTYEYFSNLVRQN